MIGRLRGKIEAIGEDRVLLDVGGVGYEVIAGARTLREVVLGDRGELYIQTRMSDSVIRLYGFSTELERAWFVGLQTVQGVGARAALAVLDAVTVMELADAVSIGDVAAVQRAKGIGKTIAQRIVTQFEGKSMPSDGFIQRGDHGAVQVSEPRHAGVISALINLGYGRSEAARAVHAVGGQEGDDVLEEAEIIRLALRVLAQG